MQREFTRAEGFAFFVAMIGVQLESELFANWGTFFYSPPPDSGRVIYVAIALVAIVFVTGRLFDVVSDPFIGSWSDRTDPERAAWWRPRGRRRPFIFWGAVAMTVTGILFWYPPVAATSNANLVFGTAVISTHWLFYTLAYIPILALAPEVARTTSERIRLGRYIGIGMTLGLVAAVVLPGWLIVELDPARDAGAASPLGYQRVAIVFALVSLGCFWWLVLAVRERPGARGGQTASVSPVEGWRMVRAHRPLRHYLLLFGLFYLGVLAAQRVTPYWVTLGLAGDEAMVSKLGLAFMVACLAATLAAPRLERAIGVRAILVIAIGLPALALPGLWLIPHSGWSAEDRFVGAVVLNLMQGAAIGLLYVLQTPLLGRLIDLESERSGRRSEGLVNAIHVIVVTGAQVISIALATGMMALFGNSSERPEGVFLVGPAAAICCAGALALAVRYPRLDATINT